MLRVATAVVLLPLLWWVVREGSRELFVALALPLIAVASWECFRMLEARGSRPFTALGIVATAALCWSFSGRAGMEPSAPLTALVLVTLPAAMWLRGDPREMLESCLATWFPPLLVGLGLAYVVGLRGMPGEDGQDLLLLLFVCVMAADTCAFFVGSKLGRRRLAPRLSPKKSWEGVAGGLAGSIAGALVAHAWFYRRLPLEHALALGVILGVAAIVGDLAESMVKRAAGVKDSSNLVPGHGGLLDRTDSFLLSAPLLYHYYRLFLETA